MTGEAADKLTEAFGFNIPQRWSIAHLYQAVLNGEPHVKISRTSRRLQAMCIICSRAKMSSAWEKPPVCSPLTARH